MEGDSKILIEAINGVIQIPWRLFTIVHNVRALIPCTFNHILCEANIVADALAAIGHQIPSRHVWFGWISCLLLQQELPVENLY